VEGGEFKYNVFDILLRIFVNATMYPHQQNNFFFLKFSDAGLLRAFNIL
jgi:hypothetical protein